MLQKKNLRIHATLLSAEVNMSAIIGKQKTHQSGALSLPTYLYLPPSIDKIIFMVVRLSK